MASTKSGLKLVSQAKSFGGWMQKLEHTSEVLGGLPARFNVFLPAQSYETHASRMPYIVYLSGLTCTEDNVAHKSGLQKPASEMGVAVVMPDTSPRGARIAGEDDRYDFGSGAGFYVNATEHPWSDHYRMYDYINEELPGLLRSGEFESLIKSNLNCIGTNSGLLDHERAGITGHSMGGHGALVSFLRNRHLWRSVSAFSPICNPCECPWGQSAFAGYLGSDHNAWKSYDACELIRNPLICREGFDLLIDQGINDDFFSGEINQLRPESLSEAVSANSSCVINLDLRYQDGYDHSYYFIASFISDHLRFHSERLC